MFPSTLLGAAENWTLMKTISVTEYLNYEAGQLSYRHCSCIGFHFRVFMMRNDNVLMS